LCKQNRLAKIAQREIVQRTVTSLRLTSSLSYLDNGHRLQFYITAMNACIVVSIAFVRDILPILLFMITSSL
jgi:hypothetical protein